MFITAQLYAVAFKVMLFATIVYGIYAFNEAYIVYRLDKQTIEQKARLSKIKNHIENTSIVAEQNELWVTKINKTVVDSIVRAIFNIEPPDPISSQSMEYLNMTRGEANPMVFKTLEADADKGKKIMQPFAYEGKNDVIFNKTDSLEQLEMKVMSQ